VFGVLLGVAALAAVAVGVIALTGGGKAASSASHSPSTDTLASHRTTPSTGLVAVQPSTVTVSVLNGTDMQGLAGRVAQRLAGVGYRKGSVTNASDQTQAKTVIAYMTAADRADALAVAQALKLSTASVQPVDPNTKAIVCPPSQACTSMVVAIVGQDLAAQ
jgi:LytR cell envelope-related transcriptional attenuator